MSTARQTLSEQLNRVESGEKVSITGHGQMITVLVRPGVLKARRAPQTWAEADRTVSLLESALGARLVSQPVISPERAQGSRRFVTSGRPMTLPAAFDAMCSYTRPSTGTLWECPWPRVRGCW